MRGGIQTVNTVKVLTTPRLPPLRLMPSLAMVVTLLTACTLAPERPPTRAVSALDCRPAVLRADDILELSMKTPHGGYLGVVAPGEFWFLLIYPNPEPARPSMMLAQRFRQLDRLALPVATTRAAPWVHGHQQAVRVFRKPGDYKILISQNLLSHDYPVSSCRVRYVGDARG
jgi:hypothetical protein